MANNQKREFKIPEDVKLFASLTEKKYMKKYADDYESKKERRKGYYAMLLSELPEVIKLLVNYSHVKEVLEIKHDIYERLFDKKLIKKITKEVDDDIDNIENITLFPIIIYDVIKEASIQHAKEKEEDPDAKEFDLSDLVNLSNMILRKKMKKLEKAGVSKELAFDCLSVIPSSKVLEKGMYRMRQLMQILYTHAKTEEIKIEPIMKYVVTGTYYPVIITYLLLERKSEFVNLDDKQKEFFNTVTDWAFNRMEEMEKTEIRQILTSYFEARKRDKKNNKDSNRRFFLGSLPENEFPNITKVLAKMKDSDSSIEEFL